MTATTEEELAAYKGKLKGKWVLTQAAPDVAAFWKPPATRYTRRGTGGDGGVARAPQPEFGVTPPGAARRRPAGAARRPRRRAPPGQPQPASAPRPPGAAGPAPVRRRRGIAARNAFFKAEGVLGTHLDGAARPRHLHDRRQPGGRSGDDAAGRSPSPPSSTAASRACSPRRSRSRSRPTSGTPIHPNPPVFNIVGEIPGTDKADEVVMLGAHFDTWHAATGATDDGVGVAAMMEAMRILKATGVKLRRTVRIGLWGGEEQGLLGSREYVAAHFASRQAPAAPGRRRPAQRRRARRRVRGGFGGPQGPLELKPDYDKFSVYFNIDNGTGALRGVYLQGNDAVAPIFREWMEPFRSLGMTTLTIRNTGGTDHQSFDAVGLPGFQFIQDEVEYNTMTHHTNLDNYERLQPSDIMKMATIVAGFAYLAANRDEKLPRKPMPAPTPVRGGGQ